MKSFHRLFASGALAISLFAILQPAAYAAEVAWEQDPSLPIVNINIAFRAGSVADPTGQSGITNFVTHLLLRGTRKRSKEQIDLAIDQMGAQLGVETRAESVILRGAVLSSQLDKFLALLGEILSEPSFPEKEIRKLKAEITAEILDELGHDATLASRRFTRFLFDGHPFGKPVAGTPRDIERLTRAKLQAQYAKYFRPEYLLVVGTGDATEARIQAWTAGLTLNGVHSAVGHAELATHLSAPTQATATRMLIVDKPEVSQTQIYIGQIGMTLSDPDYFPIYVANHAFGGGSFNSRLMVEIRVKRGWSYGAHSSFRYGTVPRNWTVYTFPANKDTPETLALALKMLRDYQMGGLTADEFTFARDSLINSAGFMYDTPKKRVENKLLERTLDLPEGFMKSYAGKLRVLALDQVNAAVKRLVKPEQQSIVVLATAADLKEKLAKAAGVPADKVRVLPFAQDLDDPATKSSAQP